MWGCVSCYLSKKARALGRSKALTEQRKHCPFAANSTMRPTAHSGDPSSVRAQVCNAYGSGLTDWDMSSLYGKLCIFAFAAWAGSDGGVTAGLAICGVMLSVTSAACGALLLCI